MLKGDKKKINLSFLNKIRSCNLQDPENIQETSYTWTVSGIVVQNVLGFGYSIFNMA